MWREGGGETLRWREGGGEIEVEGGGGGGEIEREGGD